MTRPFLPQARKIAEEVHPGWQHNEQLAEYLAEAMAQSERMREMGQTSNHQCRKAA